MKQELLDATYELVDEIKATSTYQRLVELKHIIENDLEIKELVESFQKWNDKFEETKQYGKYHPDLKSTRIAFSEAKSKLYSHEIVAEYKQLEQELQQQLDEISTAIASSISKKIKHPNEIGLMPKH